ncbi:hypothetical protein ARMSODRAFT_1026625 [Armillaria solidipes]|uniref:Uncharacterized protein n=1 Tax=Armillaria solidipes TaxID=1076256 RepID=A0A2H3AZU7_9AGAR|nr:hypothetical protein ARMSODRAFT_1026625 [Armillaria solidipes]
MLPRRIQLHPSPRRRWILFRIFTNDQVRYSILVPEYTEIFLSVPEEVSDLILEFVRLDHPSNYTALLHSCSHIKIFYYPTRRRLFRFIRYDPSSYDLLLVIFSKNVKLSSFVQILALDAKHMPDIHKLSHLTAVRTLFLYSEGPRPATISAEVLDRPVPMTHVRDVLLFNVTLDINGFRKLLHLCPGWTELGTENAVITDVPGGIDGNDCVRQYHFKRIPTRPRQSLSRRSSMESDAKVGRAVDLDRLLRMPFVFSCMNACEY